MVPMTRRAKPVGLRRLSVENVEKKEVESEALSEDLVLGHLICRLRVRRKKVNLSLGQICHAMKKPS